MIELQQTIANEITVKGVGLHTGKNVSLTFKPAEENTGYRFRRTDLPDKPIIKADIDYVTETTRGTTLKYNDVILRTIEHVLAAVAGLNIDNVLIEMDSEEPPIMDGSSKYFVEALKKVGRKEQNAKREYFIIDDNIHFQDAELKVDILAIPNDEYKITVMIDYDSPVLGRQHATLHKKSDFADNYASCRTFVFLHELELLLKNNLIKGGDLNNAIVIVDRMLEDNEMDNLAELFNKPRVDIKKEGILNADLYYQNEPARHKLLDLVGDLALVGMPIKGRIIATRPGHSVNIAFGKKIKAQIKKNRKKPNLPKIDQSNPLYNVNQIRNILPHRPPFLLVDKILEMTEDYVIGAKGVTMNEPFFTGHFPHEPVMPGVLIIEAMAQAGGILALSTVPDPENYSTYFLKIDKVKFKHKVVPGDMLIFKLELLAPIRRGICNMKALAFVENKIVAEGELMAQIVNTSNK